MSSIFYKNIFKLYILIGEPCILSSKTGNEMRFADWRKKDRRRGVSGLLLIRYESCRLIRSRSCITCRIIKRMITDGRKMCFQERCIFFCQGMIEYFMNVFHRKTEMINVTRRDQHICAK